MNKKRFLTSALVVFIFLTLFSWLWHGVLLKGLYAETQQFWRPMEEARPLMPLTHLANILFALFFSWIYTKGIEGRGSAAAEGLRYGLWIGLLLYLPMTLTHYVYLPYPVKLHWAWLLGGVVQLALGGAVVGMVFGNRVGRLA